MAGESLYACIYFDSDKTVSAPSKVNLENWSKWTSTGRYMEDPKLSVALFFMFAQNVSLLLTRTGVFVTITYEM